MDFFSQHPKSLKTRLFYKMKSKLSYEQSDRQLQTTQNETLLVNTKLTKWTFIVSVIVGIFSAISAIAEILQLYF